MDLTKISASEFTRIQGLLQKKGRLQDEIRSIDAELTSIQSGVAPVAKRGRKPGRPAKAATTAEKPKAKAKAKARPAKRGKRGAVKDSIIALLKASGPEGLTAREVADKLGAKSINISTWFSSTGKQIPQIKAGPNGKRIWQETASPAAPEPPAEPAPAPVA